MPDLFLWRKDAASDGGKAAHPADPLPAPETGVCAAQTTPERPNVVDSKASTWTGRDVDEEARKGDSESKQEAYCKWVEVKGPGDSLSCAQEAWIDTLVGAGADFVLLRVEDTAASPG